MLRQLQKAVNSTTQYSMISRLTHVDSTSSKVPKKKRKRNNLSECERLFFGGDSGDDGDVEELSADEALHHHVQQEIEAYQGLKKLPYKHTEKGNYENPLLWWKDYEVGSAHYRAVHN